MLIHTKWWMRQLDLINIKKNSIKQKFLCLLKLLLILELNSYPLYNSLLK